MVTDTELIRYSIDSQQHVSAYASLLCRQAAVSQARSEFG
jgi:hypothetical protein